VGSIYLIESGTSSVATLIELVLASVRSNWLEEFHHIMNKA